MNARQGMGSRMNSRLKTGLLLLLEFATLFVLGELACRLLIGPGLDFKNPQMIVVPHPTRIYDHRPNQNSFTIDKPFVTNSMGFRENREIPLEKNGEFRILSLGDSIAVGLGVTAEDTYAAQLEKRINQPSVKVINAAVGSYSTWSEVDLLKEKGLKIRPDIVMIAFFWNDLYKKPVPVLPLSDSAQQADARTQGLRWLKQSSLLMFLRERLEILSFRFFSPTFDWAHQEMIYEGRSSAYLEEAYKQTGSSLEEFKALADANGFIPLLIIVPIPSQVHHLDAPTHMQQHITELARRAGIRVVDLLSPMQHAYQTNPDLFIPWDNVHFTPQGHRVIAETLEQYLVTEDLLRQKKIVSFRGDGNNFASPSVSHP